jgi:RNA polymerase sigma-70 factor, ECF subfamily
VTVAISSQPRASTAPAELDDLTLARARRGDPAGCRALVARYQGPVFALLGRVLGAGRRAAVEDLAQDTFLAVFQGLPGFVPGGAARLSSWILTIASRRAIDHLRKPTAGPGPVSPEDLVIDPSLHGRADAGLERRQLAAAIDRAIADLAPPYRAAFVLYELHGLDYQEIAAALDIDAGTVKSRLARARAALRTALAELHHDR